MIRQYIWKHFTIGARENLSWCIAVPDRMKWDGSSTKRKNIFAHTDQRLNNFILGILYIQLWNTKLPFWSVFVALITLDNLGSTGLMMWTYNNIVIIHQYLIIKGEVIKFREPLSNMIICKNLTSRVQDTVAFTDACNIEFQAGDIYNWTTPS